jgi:hypothetical protein
MPIYKIAPFVTSGMIGEICRPWKPPMRSYHALEGVSQRAVLAFSCGISEWLVYRLARLCDNSMPWDYIEAAWAMTINVWYCGYGPGGYWEDYSDEGWEGPVKDPISDALNLLETQIKELAWDFNDPAHLAGFSSTLTTYVMTDPVPYKRWCQQVLERFEAIYPRNPKDELGDVVPRQAIDPEYDFKIEKTEFLINEFLSRIDYHSNIFLSSPENMLAVSDDEYEGFRGTPYTFDIKADRKMRREKK